MCIYSMCMIMPTEANVTLKDFKNKEGNAEVIVFQISKLGLYHVFCYFEYQEMRECPEVYVEFQKAKKEDHLLKWRKLEVDDVPQSSSQAELYAANMTVEGIVKGMSFCASFSMVIYHVSYFCCCKCQVSILGMKTRKS